MVARGDGHRGGDAAQSGGQSLGGLPVSLGRVQQVSGQEHQIGPSLDGGVGQGVQQKPLFAASLPGLFGGEGGKRGVQMEVGGV